MTSAECAAWLATYVPPGWRRLACNCGGFGDAAPPPFFHCVGCWIPHGIAPPAMCDFAPGYLALRAGAQLLVATLDAGWNPLAAATHLAWADRQQVVLEATPGDARQAEAIGLACCLAGWARVPGAPGHGRWVLAVPMPR